MQIQTTNRLINEKSPYLLQHAHNPVDWYPWGDEAFDKAKKEDKPVFLSIGYSTCHWCHVMERESFEDNEVAEILNKGFVSIKVDREERPDIDTIYMAVCQALTNHGGWPLTVIMTPEKKPFFAGTYFPKTSSRGMPGLMDILTRVTKLWAARRDELLKAGHDITATIQNSMFRPAPGDISENALHRAFRHYDNTFDPEFGGFGRAPKFPSAHNLSFLLRYWKLTGLERALEMVEKTLDSMYLGGIYDHIGYGFARYSTDREWLVPHFEKMLYDNALLSIAYLEAYQVTGKGQYAKAAREIFTYVLRDMTSPRGGFYSAEDADSEGEEGKFYLWTPEEVREVLGEDDGSRFCRDYDITPNGNFEGKSIPNLIGAGYIEGHGQDRENLFRKREERIHPFKDDKILTGWNGLMIAAMALGSRVLGEKKYSDAAEKSASFIMDKLRRKDGRLLARYRDGEAAYLAYAEDYAYLIWGLIELYQATFDPIYLDRAQELNTDLLRLFWDQEEGGLFQYGSDAENLIARPKEVYDGAVPSANSVAVVNFLRLARLTGDQNLEQTARRQFNAFGGTVSETPIGYPFFLTGVHLDLAPPVEITITGNLQAEETKEMVMAINRHFIPEAVLKFKAGEGQTTAHICRNYSCLAPITDIKTIDEVLADNQKKPDIPHRPFDFRSCHGVPDN